MIVCDDTDLFGGRISIISARHFCCRIETAGECLPFAPATQFHDVLQFDEVNEARPVACLYHHPAGGTDGLLKKHQMLVEFVNAVARSDDRLRLASAVRLACREFSYFGAWKLLADARASQGSPYELVPSFADRPQEKDGFTGSDSRSVSHLAMRGRWHHLSHADSPLAD